MASSHNKKRNSLLIYEFLVRTISKALVENDKKRSSTALKIIKRHFKPGTELYKEFRLMNALARSTISSQHVAASILKEAKSAALSLNESILSREKSLLIRNINHGLDDDDFYDQHISEYRTYATIQTLLNEWRSTSKDIMKIANFEDQVMLHLTTPKTATEDSTITEDTAGTSRLLMKVMTKKLNEKYNGILNDQQKSLIKTYAYSTVSEDKTSIKKKLSFIKNDLLQLLENDDLLNGSDYVRNKLVETRNLLVEEKLENINDDTITRFMLYSRLKDELESKE